MTLVIGMSIGYVDYDRTLCNILCLSRDLNDVLKDEVLKQALLRSNQTKVMSKRK